MVSIPARVGIFLLIQTDPAIRLCSVAGGHELPADLVDVAGGLYSGLELTGIPAVQQLINGTAQRADFTLAGVPKEASYQAELEVDDVRGASINLGFLRFDAEWQPMGAARWLWQGTADVLFTDRHTDESGAVTRAITLSAGTENTGRKRASFESYTPLSQRSRSPTDAFCDLVPRYTQGSTKLWA